ncbi:MAG: hypothetical protein L0Y56_12790 [Nitrospira sp.]|nr:hypothetical protein [Nitrospira sp.]
MENEISKKTLHGFRGKSACNAWTPQFAKTPAYLAKTGHLVVFTFLTIAQSIFHMGEHIAQVIQKYIFHMAHAHGILGFFDLEWVHFFYNVGLLTPMIPILAGCGFFSRENGWARYSKKLYYTVLFAFWVQVWHVPEHVIKVYQHIQTGEQGTPGFLGQFVPVIWLHFWINLVVSIPLLVAFIGYDMLGALRERLGFKYALEIRSTISERQRQE